MLNKNKNICKESVFEKLYHLYAKELRNFLIYKFQDVQASEDVVQECFVKLWQNCAEVEFEKVKSFLFTVGNNTFINIKKHEQIVRKHQTKAPKQSSDNVSPEFIIIEEEYARKLHKLINSLPEKQKEVFMMSRIEKLKYREIAEILDVSIKTVEKRMSSALIYLREHLEYFK